MTAFTDALNNKSLPSTSLPSKATPFQSALAKISAPPVNKFGQDVSTHVMNPLNPNNQINAPQPSTSTWQNFKSSIGPTIKQGLNKVYDIAGGLVAPGITPTELRNPQILKDTALGLPKAAYQVGQQIVKHPLDTTVNAVRSATKGLSNTITNGIINVFVPKADRAATQAQVQTTLDKYLGSPQDYKNPVQQGISQGFEVGGAAAPYIAAGEAGGALGGKLGTVGGFALAGQTQVPLEATASQRANQLANDLVALGLFEAGSAIFNKVKTQAQTIITDTLLKPSVKVVPDRVVHTTTGDKTYFTIPEDKARTVIDKVDNQNTGHTATDANGNNLHITAKTPAEMEAQGYKLGGAISPDNIKPPVAIKYDAQGQAIETPAYSKVGKSIEAKAIEKGLTEGFQGTAEYDPTTIKEQARLTSDLLKTDIDKAVKMAMGEESIPRDIRGGSLLKALEDYAFTKGDVGLIRDLANSPLAAETSIHAQELRMLAERNPESPVALLRNLKQTRETRLAKKTGEEVTKLKSDTIKEIKSEVKPIPKDAWSSFIDSIKC